MRKRIVVLGLLMAVGVSSPAWGFNGLRKGFVLGGGLGVAPTAGWSITNTNIDESKVGVGAQFFLGYAWDEQNMIVWEGNAASYSSGNADIGQGFGGAVWYHYFGPVGRSFFTNAGLGFYSFNVSARLGSVTVSDHTDPSGALMLGGGYEFARHVQVVVYVAAGRTTLGNVDFDHHHVNVLMSAVAF